MSVGGRRGGAVVLAAALSIVPALASASFLGIGDDDPEYRAGAKGSFLEQIEQKNAFPKKPYAPPSYVVAPFAHARISPEVAYALTQNVNFADESDAQRLAQGVVDRLLTAWAGPRPNVTVLITAEASYGGHANQTGHIFLAIGTFNPDSSKGVASLDELALLLGHELGHVLLGHLDHIGDTQRMTDAVGFAATGFVAESAVKNSRVGPNGVTIAGDQRMVDMGLIGGLAANTLLADILAPSWGRDNELNADKIGLDLARRAGFMVGEDEFMQFIKKHCDEQTERSQRMERLSTVIKSVAAEQKQPQSSFLASILPGMPDILNTVANNAIDGVFNALAKARKDHPSPEERAAALKIYFAKAYPDPDTGPDGRLLRRDVRGLTPVTQAGSFHDLLVRITVANHDLETITQSMASPSSGAGGTTPNASGAAALPAALAVRARAIAQSTEASPSPSDNSGGKPGKKSRSSPPSGYGTDAAPMTWEVSGELLTLAGSSSGAQRAWENGVRSQWASVALSRDLGQTYTHNSVRLTRFIDDFRARMGSDDEIPDLVVANLVAQGDIAGAEVKAAACYDLEDHRYYPSCAAYLGYDPTQSGVEAKTDAGKKAFRGKALTKPFEDIFSPISSIFK